MNYFVTHLDDARLMNVFEDLDESVWHFMTESGIPERVMDKRGQEVHDELLEMFHNEGELDPENSRDLEVLLKESKAARLTIYLGPIENG